MFLLGSMSKLVEILYMNLCFVMLNQGYQHIPAVLGLQHLRQVRGDNYCAIRAVLYQALVGGVDVTAQWGSLATLMKVNELRYK